MSTSESFMKLWNLMEFSEKQRLMRQFLSQHGDHFTKADFVRFLSLRFDDGDQEFKPLTGKQNNSERRV